MTSHARDKVGVLKRKKFLGQNFWLCEKILLKKICFPLILFGTINPIKNFVKE